MNANGLSCEYCVGATGAGAGAGGIGIPVAGFNCIAAALGGGESTGANANESPAACTFISSNMIAW